MGKTKTAFVGDEDKKQELSGAEEYKLKQAKKAQKKAQEVSGTEHNEAEAPKTQTKKQVVGTRGKKYISSRGKIDKNKVYEISEAINLIKDASYSKFDGTMELHMGVKKTGLSTNVTLPHSTGKTKKIEVADSSTLEKLAKGKIDFDVLLATPEMMPKIIPFARLLGPKGLLPNPKNGTVIKKPEDAKRFSADTLSIKTEKDFPLIHTSFGKVSMDTDKLKANAEAILNAVGTKQIVSCYLKATMSPSVKISI
jgi:large subunit ribosomal protein L1